MSDHATPIPTPDAGYVPHPKESHTLSFWLGLVVAPMLWFLNLNVCYALVTYVQKNPGRQFVLPLSSTLFFLLAVLCAYLSFRDLHRSASDIPAARRLTFLAPLAVLSCLLFAIAILAQFLAAFFFSPYWD